jgi:hypothetical protein
MKQLHVTTYRLHPDLDREDLEEITKLFGLLDNNPGMIAHYMATGVGVGFVISEACPFLQVGRDDAGTSTRRT